MIKKITNKDIIDGSFVIPDGVTKIGEFAFYECTSLESVIIPESVSEIGEYAFDGCKNLKNLIIPEGVTKIWNRAFEDCTSLKKVSLPKKFKLGEEVFLGCNPDLKIEYRD